jgi:hypothetical protein
MSNNIEDFIHGSRGGFDDEVPSSAVWNRVEAGLPAKKEARRFSLKEMYKRIAAAAILCIMLTSLYFLYVHKKDAAAAAMETPAGNKSVFSNADISSISPEYATAARQVSQAIEIRQAQLRKVTSEQPELYRQFLKDLRVLDSSYQMLQTQAAHTPNPDVIVKAMLQNLQLQAELLARQLMIMNEIKNTKAPQHEKIS